MIRFTVSTTQPRTVFTMFQLQSPFQSFFKETSWDTVKTVLGWVVDTVNLTIHPPPHRIERLWQILDSIPPLAEAHQHKEVSHRPW